jgi:hypothetical protein
MRASRRSGGDRAPVGSGTFTERCELGSLPRSTNRASPEPPIGINAPFSHETAGCRLHVQMQVTLACLRVIVDPPAQRLDVAEIGGYATVETRVGRKDIEPAPTSPAAAVQRLPPDLPTRWKGQRASWWGVVVPLVTEVVRDEVVRTADGVGDGACGEPSANSEDDERDQ